MSTPELTPIGLDAASTPGSRRASSPNPAGRGRTIEAEIADIAPTILYLLGQPIPSDLDGRLVTQALAPELLERRPPVYAEEDGSVLASPAERYSPEDEATVEERLRSLGYLESHEHGSAYWSSAAAGRTCAERRFDP